MKNKFLRISACILIITIIVLSVIYIFRARIIAHFIPNVEQVGDVYIKVKDDTTYVSSELTVENKSFLKIEIDTIKYKITLFNKTYLQNQKFIGIVLHGYEKGTLGFSLKIPYVSILKDLGAERRKGDSASYSINVFLQYSTIFGRLEIPINKSAKLKIPQPPELNIVEIKYSKIRLKSILANVTVKVVNYSDVNLSIKEMTYSMYVSKQGKLKGKLKKTISIKPNGTTFINIPIEINLNNLIKTVFDVIINKDIYDYKLSLNAILESSSPFKQSFHIDLTKNGKMELNK